jgi:hypothetical protein
MLGTALKWVFGSGGVADILPKIKDIAEVFVGNKRERDATSAANEHDEQIELHKSQTAGYTYGVANRTWFDVAIDGLNRLPRPLMTIGIIWLMFWAGWQPESFKETMAALGAMPEWLATIITVIIVFWFGSRTIAKDIPEQVTANRLAKSAVAGAKAPATAPKVRAAVDTADDNDVIDAWRRKAFNPGA